jgi:hypothetical protein
LSPKFEDALGSYPTGLPSPLPTLSSPSSSLSFLSGILKLVGAGNNVAFVEKREAPGYKFPKRLPEVGNEKRLPVAYALENKLCPNIEFPLFAGAPNIGLESI